MKTGLKINSLEERTFTFPLQSSLFLFLFYCQMYSVTLQLANLVFRCLGVQQVELSFGRKGLRQRTKYKNKCPLQACHTDALSIFFSSCRSCLVFCWGCLAQHQKQHHRKITATKLSFVEWSYIRFSSTESNVRRTTLYNVTNSTTETYCLIGFI